MTDDQRSLLVALADATKVYGLSRDTFKRLCAKGELNRTYPMGPYGGCYLFRAEVEGLIRRNTVKPGHKVGRKPTQRVS